MNLTKKKIISLTKINNPFLMVDKIVKIKQLKSGIGKKKINKNLWFFKSHFIDDPVMPGSLIQESMLQSIVSILYANKNFKNKICLIISANTNFYNKVDKETDLNIYVTITKLTKKKVIAKASVYNSKKIKIASGDFKYFITYR